jgi:hypothetical protein
MTRTTAEEAGLREAVAAQRRDLAALLGGLAPAAWDHPSLCAGWRVRERRSPARPRTWRSPSAAGNCPSAGCEARRAPASPPADIAWSPRRGSAMIRG